MASPRVIRSKDRKERRAPVDPQKPNMGNTYSVPPEYYYDQEFNCIDCGIHQVWTAQQQKWWYEEAGGYIFATANRCRTCREKERTRKSQARFDSGHSNE